MCGLVGGLLLCVGLDGDLGYIGLSMWIVGVAMCLLCYLDILSVQFGFELTNVQKRFL